MNLLEISILYLACGAPFGVYYFFQSSDMSERSPFSVKSWANCLLITFFWLPFAIKLLHQKVTNKLSNSDFVEKSGADSTPPDEFAEYETAIAQILLENRSAVSLFEFREIFQRYLGLTLANSADSADEGSPVSDLYVITGHDDPELATICLNRRNRMRLATHHILARQDFLQVIAQIGRSQLDRRALASQTLRFAKIVNDATLLVEVNRMFDGAQTEMHSIVKEREKKVWIPIIPDQPPMPNEVLNLPATSVTAMIPKPD